MSGTAAQATKLMAHAVKLKNQPTYEGQVSYEMMIRLCLALLLLLHAYCKVILNLTNFNAQANVLMVPPSPVLAT